jgi:hypothetical protein
MSELPGGRQHVTHEVGAVNVDGFVADGYDAVRQGFQRLVDDGLETGAGL